MIVFLPLIMVRLAIMMMEADALLQQNAAARAPLRYYRGTWLDDRVSASHHGATGHRDDGGGRPAAAERRGEGAAALLPRHVAR